MSKARAAANKPVVVTTKHRGVFFGYGDPNGKATVRITQARMCIYWSTDVKGVLGLAATGPTSGCKVGPAVPAITLRDVTAVIEVSESAAKAWESSPWAR